MSILPLSIYLHFPWCLSKCPYCDFNSRILPQTTETIEQYLSAMQNDLKREHARLDSKRSISSIFWGGGTPSLLSAAQIGDMLDFIAKLFDLNEKLEITIEANPLTIDPPKARQLLKIGVNRISLGIQSFDSRALDSIGRQHQPACGIESAKILQDAGFHNLNLDLMYGLPHQTTEAASADLEQAMHLKPAHISWYQLTLTENQKRYWQSKGKPLPDADEIYKIEQTGRNALAAGGFERYEISAYAAAPHLRCAHNLNYWQYGDYLGIGAGACGKITNSCHIVTRAQKNLNPLSYPKNPLASEEEITPKQQELEFMLNACRTLLPIPYRWMAERTTCNVESWLAKLQKLSQEDLIKMQKTNFTVTKRGSEMLDSWLLEFA